MQHLSFISSTFIHASLLGGVGGKWGGGSPPCPLSFLSHASADVLCLTLPFPSLNLPLHASPSLPIPHPPLPTFHTPLPIPHPPLPMPHPPLPMLHPPFPYLTFPFPYLTLPSHASPSLPLPHPPLPMLQPLFPYLTLPSHASTSLPMPHIPFPCLSQATCSPFLCSHSYFLKPLILTF